LPRWIEQINRYHASQRGLDAPYIADSEGHLRPLGELVAELLTLVEPVAEKIGEAQGISFLRSFLSDGVIEV
jgi:gamma-glutamyl:cysteine ligase YbdK (ATP-grasp superfamily)